MKLTKLFNKHLTNLHTLKRDEVTIKDHKSKLGRFVMWFIQKDLKDITANDMEIYKADLIQNYASGTVNGHIEKINALFNYFYKADYLERDRLDKLKLSKVVNIKKDKQLPSLQHILETINKFPEDKKDMCLIALELGLAWKELCNITNDDFNSKVLYVKNSKNAYRTREIPITTKVHTILNKYSMTSKGAKLFPSAPHFRKWLLRNLTHKDAKFTPNLLKHIFATNISNKVDKTTLRTMLGHAKGSTTADKYYVHSNYEEVRKDYILWQNKINRNRLSH